MNRTNKGKGGKKNCRGRRRLLIWTLVPAAPVLIGAVVLFVPPVQSYVLKKAIQYAGKQAGMEIRAERIRISYPLKLSVANIFVASEEADSLFCAGNIELKINTAMLFRKIISVERFTVQNVKLHTGAFIEDVNIDGSLGYISATAIVDINEGKAGISRFEVADANASIILGETKEKEQSEPVEWTVSVDDIELNRIYIDLQMPADSMTLNAYVDKINASMANADLAAEIYSALSLNIDDAAITFDSGDREAAAGFDADHIGLSCFSAAVDSVSYSENAIRLLVKSLSAEERSGLIVSSLSGGASMEGSLMHIPELSINTPNSFLKIKADIPTDAFSGDAADADIYASLEASIGKKDVKIFVDKLPPEVEKQYLNLPVLIDIEASGNMNSLHLSRLNVTQEKSFSFKAKGNLGNITDSVRRSADVDFLARLQSLRLGLSGKVSLDSQVYDANIEVSDVARALLGAKYSSTDDSYEISLAIDSLHPSALTEVDSSMFIAMKVKARGRGFDFFADSTWSVVEGKISDFRVDSLRVGNVAFEASLLNHAAEVNIYSREQAAVMDIGFEGTVRSNSVEGMFVASVDSLDLEAMKIMDSPFSTSFQMFSEVKSNLRNAHSIDMTVGNWEMNFGASPLRAKLLTISAKSETDTTNLSVNAGDLRMNITGNAGWEKMQEHIDNIGKEAARQIREDSTVHITGIQPLLPEISLSINAGRDNPVYDVLRSYDIDFNRFYVKANSSPDEGLSMDAELYSLYRDTFRIDTIRAIIRPDSGGMNYMAEVVKNRYMQQQAFLAQLKGKIRQNYADAELLYRNNRKETGLLLGLKGNKTRSGIELNFFPDTAILAFNPFAVNGDNYIRFKNSKEFEANLLLKGSKNEAITVQTVESEDSVYKTLEAELRQIPLDVISNGFVGLPDLEGTVSLDLRYTPTAESFSVMGDMHVDDLVYKGEGVGDMMINALYLPDSADTHLGGMQIFRNNIEIGSAGVIYSNAGKSVYGSFGLTDMPLEMLTPFVPQASFVGKLNAEASISGKIEKPAVSGFLKFDTASIYSSELSSRYRLDDKRINIDKSILRFDDYQIFSSGERPFIIDGIIDFADMDNIVADLKAGGNNLQLLNARRSNESMAYGRLLANVSTTIRGPLDALTVRGNIRLLGGTNMTYVMHDSPLAVEDRLVDLVTFSNFADSAWTRMRRRSDAPQIPMGGTDMLLLVHIDPIVQLSADITPDRSSYVSLEGGGDISFQYNRQGQMVVNGRYTLSDGKMKYALPVIGTKEFKVKRDSYIQWDGDIMDPQLRLAATQHMRSTVEISGQQPQPVDFEVGIDVRERLNNMNLMFTIEAPENASVQSELDRMGAEGRSTKAVGMMVTGLYLGSGNGGAPNMNMGNALNSLIQSEIKSLAGSVLQKIDISLGINSYEPSAAQGGGQRTDYTFNLAKRFYNDRLRISAGGKLSSGNVQNKESFLDNVSLEWKLNKSGTDYLRLFHEKSFQSILDGEIRKTGAGVVLRRKMLHPFDLFRR